MAMFKKKKNDVKSEDVNDVYNEQPKFKPSESKKDVEILDGKLVINKAVAVYNKVKDKVIIRCPKCSTVLSLVKESEWKCLKCGNGYSGIPQ